MKKMNAEQIKSMEEFKADYMDAVKRLEKRLAEYDADLNSKTTCLVSHNWLFVVESTGGYLGDEKMLCWIYMKDHFEHVSGIKPSLDGVPHYTKETANAENIRLIQKDVDKYVKEKDMKEIYTAKVISSRDFKITQREETKRLLDNAREVLENVTKKLKEMV